MRFPSFQTISAVTYPCQPPPPPPDLTPTSPSRPCGAVFRPSKGGRAVLDAARTRPSPLRAATGKGERRPGQPTGPTAPSLIISGKRGAAPRPHNTSHLTARRQQPHNNPTTTSESSPITGDNPPRPAGNAPARWRTTVAPRAKRRRGPQGPRSNHQPQSPATGHRPKLPPPPVRRHLLPLQHRLHHGHPGAPNLHRFQQPVSLVHHLLVQLLPSGHPVAHQPLHHPLQATVSRRFNNRFCVICAIGQAHHLSTPAMVTMSSLAPGQSRCRW